MTRVGRQRHLSQRFEFNPYWARVRLAQWPDGRTDLKIASHGKEFSFGRLLNDDERRDFAAALQHALSTARTEQRRSEAEAAQPFTSISDRPTNVLLWNWISTKLARPASHDVHVGLQVRRP